MNELDRATVERVLPAAGGRSDWGDVLKRSGAQQRRQRVVVVLAALAIVAVGTAATFGMRALFLDKGFVGLPPDGAAPSLPNKGTLVVSYGGRPASLSLGNIRPMHRVWVYADGRLIWDREGLVDAGGNVLRPARQPPFYANLRKSGLLEQRLKPEGIERLRTEVLSSGLFDHNRFLVTDYAMLWGWIELRKGDRLVQVQWVLPHSPFPARRRSMTLDEKRVLARLSARLAAPASWLPARAWRDKTIRAYVPAQYGACVGSEGPHSIDAMEIVRRLPRTVRNRLRVTMAEPSGCFAMTTEDARLATNALERAKFERIHRAQGLVYAVSVRTAGRTAMGHVVFDPLLPDGELVCSMCG